MLVGRCSGLALSLAALALLGTAAAPGQTAPPNQPPPEAVAKLITQLGAEDFRSRQDATDKLEKLGGPALPTLRKAAKATRELEVKRRLELVIARIEKALLDAEEKHWQALDDPR